MKMSIEDLNEVAKRAGANIADVAAAFKECEPEIEFVAEPGLVSTIEELKNHTWVGNRDRTPEISALQAKLAEPKKSNNV
jgi:hypothetical protein